MTRWMLDATADTLPPGLIGTPFEAVYRALREVAAGVWDVDPAVYRAGIAWAFYLLERPALLERFPALVAAALVSEGAPAIRPGQTPDELVALLRVWFSYRPTYARLEALLACYGVEAEVRPVSDPDCQLVCPVSDTRLAFYIRVLGMDWARPLTADEIAEIARLASPLGARPVPFYALQAGEAPVYVASAGAGIVYSLMSGAVAQAVRGMVIGGTVGLESLVGEDFEIDPPVSLRGGIIDLSGNLQSESPSPQGTVEGGEIDLTGNLRTESPSPQGSVISDPYAIIAYKADGTTSPGIFNPAGGTYQVDAVDSSFHTAADLEVLGWYVKWRVYSKTSSNGINIRDSYGTSGTTVISVWYSGDPVVNPNLHGPEGYENWMQVKFSTDNGATIQNGWINMGATGYGISYVEQAVNKDYFLV